MDIDDITYLEKEGNYFNLFTKSGKKLLVRINFADLTEKLPPRRFFRIHKSFIVSIRHIEMIEGGYVVINKEKLPISVSFREEFLKLLWSQTFSYGSIAIFPVVNFSGAAFYGY